MLERSPTPRVLVVEDDFYIAMDVAGALRRRGCEVVGPVGQSAEALGVVRQEKIDFAILDINLDGELVFDVADQLREADVPFVFLSGYGIDVIPWAFRDVPLCEKPFRSDDLVEWLPGGPDQNHRPSSRTGLNSANLLLRQLPEGEAALLRPHVRRIETADWPTEVTGDVVYFLEAGLCSLTLGELAVEVAMVGAEGVVGAPMGLAAPRLPLRPQWHCGAEAVAIAGAPFREVLARAPRLRELVGAYHHSLTVQMAWTAHSAAALDVLGRIARWILMAADRVGGHIPVTHATLAHLLNVRRAGVTMALHILEGDRAIRSKRGLIIVRNRTDLERIVGSSYGEPERDYARAIAPWPALDG